MQALLLFVFICLANSIKVNKTFRPHWSDLDTRPLPEWYDKAKIGISVHWGVYSVPSISSEWFWYHWNEGKPSLKEFMLKNYPPGFTYQEFAPMFKGEFFKPNNWADLFAKAGAKYVVLTSKHHDGFTLFPSKRSFNWNSVDVGPKRDIVRELSEAIRSQHLKFGIYHSLYEWYNPMYVVDKKNNFSTKLFVSSKLMPDLKQLVNDYKPSVIWSDGDWEAYDSYWESTDFLAWLYNDSPVKDEIVVNDRWGIGTAGKHGDFYNYRYDNSVFKLLKHKWENAFTVDKKSWGFRRNILINELLTIEEILYQIVSTISYGGNVLINVGATKEGTIAPIFQERLLAMGSWLAMNGEAIYGSSPWYHQRDTWNSNVWYTCTKKKYDAVHPSAMPTDADSLTAIYAIILKWPTGNTLRLQNSLTLLCSDTYRVQMLGYQGLPLRWNINNGKVDIILPDQVDIESNHAWTLKFTSN